MLNSVLSISFPAGSGIEGFVYWMLSGIMSWGWVSYGVAIIFFTLFIKLIMSPLDFLNRYFTKKNQIMMQNLAPEEANLKKIYADDPMALSRARSALYRKNGGGQGGFFLVMIINLVVTLMVFFQVFGALGKISNENINKQVAELKDVYDSAEYQALTTDAERSKLLNAKYDETNISFLWIKNIWRPDGWVGQTMNWEEYKAIKPGSISIDEETYNEIFSYINPEHSGWNGLLILVLIAGAATYGSTVLSAYITNKNAPKKVGTKQVPIISYSLRDAKQQGSDQPTVDPAQMGKIMQYVMPIIMVVFAISSTAAMSLYIISSSVISTGLTLLLGFVINKIIKHQKPKEVKEDKFDPTIINPHAKYFKGK
jgi:YidC/Oxa1 family membrane protein insertase